MSFVEWLWTVGSVGSLLALALVLLDTELLYRVRADETRERVLEMGGRPDGGRRGGSRPSRR
jgi:hypothetical protein